jgi:iron complex outermembrane recepter protein
VHFGKHFSVYDAWSYTVSKYQEDYINNTTLIRTGGKKVPNSPEHLNKFVISTNWGNFDAQLSGDTVGRRYATFTNDLFVDGYTLYGLNASYKLNGFEPLRLKSAKIALSVTNLTDIEGTSTLVVGANSGTYNTYPIPPRMVFVNLSGRF